MKRLLAVLSTMLALAATSAFAQTYPTRPVTIIVPFAAGGPTDIIARIVGEYFSKSLGQQFIVENVAGAGGTTGITRGAQARLDGYTIMMGHMGTHGAAPALYPNLKYDPTKDFEPIGLVAGTPILIVARKGFPAADLKEFVARLKDPAAKVRQAHAGVGSVSFTCATKSSTWSSKSTAAPSRLMRSPRPSAHRRCPAFLPPRRQDSPITR
jgi:tripartite-type tricarboxylate transporter receptor subunit TctC